MPVPQWLTASQGRITRVQFQKALVDPVTGNVSAYGTPASLLGKWDEITPENEEEMEECTPTDVFDKIWVPSSGDTTYTFSEVLSASPGTNYLRNLWTSGIPGARYILAWLAYGGEQDALIGYLASYKVNPLKRVKNMGVIVVKQVGIRPTFT